MSVAASLTRGAGHVCRSCQLQQSKLPIRLFSSIPLTEPFPRRKTRPSASFAKISRRRQSYAATVSSPAFVRARASKLPPSSNTPERQITASNPMQTLSALRHDVSKITNATTVPEELEVLELLNRLLEFSNVLVFGKSEPPNEADTEEINQTTSAILDDLEEAVAAKTATPQIHQQGAGGMSSTFRIKAQDAVSELIYDLVRDPKVFITPDILQVYTRVQCLLGAPQYLPDIFYLFANKPTPLRRTSPIRYKNPRPHTPTAAIPPQLADAALESAIAHKNLPLAIAIIETTVACKSFRRAKLIRKLTLPALAVSTTPVIAYAGAKWLSAYQNVWDSEMSMYTTMAGALAYIGTLTSIGVVAMTTWNDQMDRVVWAVGTPLWERYRREEERAAFDRVAGAWGFKERWRRGEEAGEEWEALREEIGLRGMVLDKTELMDGME